MFIYELSDWGLKSRCCHLSLRYGTCISKDFLDIEANYGLWIHWKSRRWYCKKQSNAPHRSVLTAQINNLDSLAKWLNFDLRRNWLWVRISLLSLKPQIWRLLWARSFLTFRQTIMCGSTLKLVRDMLITYSQMNRTCKYSHHSSIILPAGLNDWVFIYQVSGCGFECRCCHLNLRYGAFLEEGVPWQSGKL